MHEQDMFLQLTAAALTGLCSNVPAPLTPSHVGDTAVQCAKAALLALKKEGLFGGVPAPAPALAPPGYPSIPGGPVPADPLAGLPPEIQESIRISQAAASGQ